MIVRVALKLMKSCVMAQRCFVGTKTFRSCVNFVACFPNLFEGLMWHFHKF